MSAIDNARRLAFADYVELEVEGNILKNAISFGDVDNDGLSELVVGNDKGKIFVFKGDASVPVYSMKINGMISTISIGDVINVGKNVLLSITGCGYLFLFDLENASSKENISPFHTQRIPANVKNALIGELTGEIFCLLTDRVVRSYRWLTGGLPGDWKTGKFVGLNKWEFAEQIGSISFVSMPDGKQSLLVAQPGGNFVMPKVESTPVEKSTTDSYEESSTEFLTKIPIDFETATNMKIQNAEICASSQLTVDTQSSGPTFSFATLDGYLVFVNHDKIQWQLKVDRQIFSLHCLDNVVAACCWDGTTFIVDQDQNVVEFTFKEPVCSFSAGLYASQGENVPSFAYTTFNNSLFLYHNVGLSSMSIMSLIDNLKNTLEFQNLSSKLGIHTLDEDALKKLIDFLLYKYNPISRK